MIQEGKEEYKIAVLLDNSRKYDRDIMRGVFQFTVEYPQWSTYLLPPSYIDSTSPEQLLKQCLNPVGAIVRDYDGWEVLLDMGMPLIISPFQVKREGVINLLSDNAAIAESVVHYFKEKGFVHFAYYGNSSYHWSEERRKAYVSALLENNHQCAILPRKANSISWSRRLDFLAEWLKAQALPLAIFCATDEYARQMSEAVVKAGLNCPNEVAILGVDNDEILCDLSSPSISSCDPNGVIAGYCAAKRIYDLTMLNDNDLSDIVIPPKDIVERHSTEIVATEDEEVKKAIIYISKYATSKNLNVSDVVDIVSVSRRLLERRFRMHLGMSILSFIMKKRTDYIKKMLVETSMSIKEIAVIMDFSNLESISRFFKKAVGVTPSEYRLKHRL